MIVHYSDIALKDLFKTVGNFKNKIYELERKVENFSEFLKVQNQVSNCQIAINEEVDKFNDCQLQINDGFFEKISKLEDDVKGLLEMSKLQNEFNDCQIAINDDIYDNVENIDEVINDHADFIDEILFEEEEENDK